MTPPFQVASLVASPSYPNAIAWSDENLIAVATGHVVTILNPQKPHSPRGLINLAPADPYPIGVVDKEDLLSDALLPICLSRDPRPCVRSISWSPLGFGPNYGCLLVVCTTEGHVKIYRQPYSEFCFEWVEVMDVSDMLHKYLAKTNYGEPVFPLLDDLLLVASKADAHADKSNITSSRKHKRRKHSKDSDASLNSSEPVNNEDTNGCSRHVKSLISIAAEAVTYPMSSLRKGSAVEVLKLVGGRRIWVSGKVDFIDGSKALVLFSESNVDGKQEWCDVDPDGINVHGENECYPQIRPAMDAGNLSPGILFIGDKGVGEALKTGQAVEAWVNSRWNEGAFVGISGSNVLVKLSDDDNAVALDANIVRLAPTWVREENVWQVTLMKVQKDEERSEVPEAGSNHKEGENFLQIVPEGSNHQHITACQFASRSALLSSLAVAWSPELCLSENAPDDSCKSCYCLLAVGAKSGRLSFWRLHRPESYSIDKHNGPTCFVPLGHLKVHEAWITTLGWKLLTYDTSNPQFMLVTGSSDGSVKIWLGSGEDLLKFSEADSAPFSLLKEVISEDFAPVSALTLTNCTRSSHNILLAVGRGSGSFEVWMMDIDGQNLKNIFCGVHDCIITGLAWAFGGCCLYSCSQDNSLRGWILHKSTLSEVPIPPNNLEIRSPSDLPCVFDSCFGVAASPGNLVIAVARSFDPDMLNPMYQARTQRAAVEFFWLGGQQLSISSEFNLQLSSKMPPGFTEKELVSWGSNILWSLNLYGHQGKPLVVWDIIVALSAFKEVAPKFLSQVLSAWLVSITKGGFDRSKRGILLEATTSLPRISSRHLHLLNVICRRVMLSDLGTDKVNDEETNPVKSFDGEEELWVKLLLNSERELRERLIGIVFSLALCKMSNPNLTEEGCWSSFGVWKMLKWVNLSQVCVRNQLNHLASEITSRVKPPSGELEEEEACSFCSSPVTFESAEFAFCQGRKYGGEDDEHRHKLVRCAISMRVCPITPLWSCVCCERQAFRLAPRLLYSLPNFPQDYASLVKSTNSCDRLSVPLCPFCGIMLQRLQPGFLLTPSLV